MSTKGQLSGGTRMNGEFVFQEAQVHDPILNDETLLLLEIIFIVAINGPISVLGSAVNIINIIIFLKQGFNDSVNINLCALAVSHLGSLLPLVWNSICTNPLFQYLFLDFDSYEVLYLTAGLPHSCFVRITGLITAFITFERCVCIALPLKVKNIITPKRTLISIIAMSVIMFSTSVPLFSSVYLTPSFHAKRNKTLIGLSFTDNSISFENFSFCCNVISQLTTFIIVIICTVILVLKIVAKSQRRHKAISTSDISESLSTRDKRVIKMVTLISVIFIICYFPGVVNMTAGMLLTPKYSNTGLYVNTYLASWAIINTIEGINSSVTILVYYNMSTKYRATFKEIFLATEVRVYV